MPWNVNKRWPQWTPEEYAKHWLARVREQCVTDANGCVLWQGWKSAKGYPFTSYRARTNVRIHRKMYELTHGVTLSPSQVVCHSCDVRHCVNPDHLWLGDTAANNRDMADKYRCKHSPGRYTHCKRGHEFTPDNTMAGPLNRRICRRCYLGRQRVRAGWPADLAYSHPPVPHGHRVGNGKWRARRAHKSGASHAD